MSTELAPWFEMLREQVAGLLGKSKDTVTVTSITDVNNGGKQRVDGWFKHGGLGYSFSLTGAFWTRPEPWHERNV